MLLLFIMPKSKVSDEENRALAQMPELSAENVFSGKYAKGIDDYLNDHFPFRTAFILAGDGLGNVFKYTDENSVEVLAGVVNDDMGEGETLYDVQDEEEEPSEPEEEPLPEAAQIDVPEKADYNSHGIIISGTRAMETFGYYDSMLESYASIVNKMSEAVPEVKVYSIVVPTAGEFYSPVEYHTGMHSQKDAISKLYSYLSPEVSPVDAYTYVAAKADEYVYFRTDHHWTARGAYQGYLGFCRAAELEAVPLESFPTEVVSDSFVGSMYRYTKRQIIKDNPDYVEVFYQPEPESCKGYTSASMGYSYDVDMISNTEKTTNKYLAFLGGDHPLLHIVTMNKNGRRLLVFKDSFGNALIPFLTNHYEEVYVVDPRSATLTVSEFCQQHEINDILMENYAFAISNSAILNGLKAAAR